ncbi:uncharacterized protein LOC131032577 [Cryptomeria japonica]|uniref:uncharacterized protein LOC131032577 n=1 Tax=Cryptomeria japonica TaxID=3369 RepID=UPI0025AD5795|nr:uncharacterized protein LOC131032577 [Cryptomeria japonica]
MCKNAATEDQDILNKSLEESNRNTNTMTTQLEEARGICEEIKSNLEAKKIRYEELESEIKVKEKECQNLKDEVVKLTKEIEKCQDDLKLRMKFEGSTNALNNMLDKQNKNKDSTSLGYEVGQCSINTDSSKKDIKFVSSSENGQNKTFKVKNSPRRKIDLTTTTESIKTLAAATRKINTDSKGKGKLTKDGFIKDKDTRIKFRRPPIGRILGYVGAHKTKQVSTEMYIQGGVCYKKV